MKIRIISLCLLCVAIFSCKKEDNFTIELPGSLLLSQILINKTASFEYTYNGAKLIREEKSKFAYSVNSYNDKNQLVSADYYVNFDILSSDPKIFEVAMKNWVTPTKSNLTGTVNYEYSAKDQLTKTIYTPSSGSLQSSQFSFDENGRINRQNLYLETLQAGYIDYSYDTDGNLIKEVLYNTTSSGGAELSTTTDYEYDNMQNPFKLISRLPTPGITTNINNIVKETRTIHKNAAQGGDVIVTDEYSYKYNSNGYPVSKSGNVDYIYQ